MYLSALPPFIAATASRSAVLFVCGLLTRGAVRRAVFVVVAIGKTPAVGISPESRSNGIPQRLGIFRTVAVALDIDSRGRRAWTTAVLGRRGALLDARLDYDASAKNEAVIEPVDRDARDLSARSRLVVGPRGGIRSRRRECPSDARRVG
jgi:hypothetical protein